MNELKIIVKDNETKEIIEGADVHLELRTPEEPGKAPEYINSWANRTNKRGEVRFYDLTYNGEFFLTVKKLGYRKLNNNIIIGENDTEKEVFIELI